MNPKLIALIGLLLILLVFALQNTPDGGYQIPVLGNNHVRRADHSDQFLLGGSDGMADPVPETFPENLRCLFQADLGEG